MKQYLIIKLDKGLAKIASKIDGGIYKSDDNKALKLARMHIEIMKIAEPYACFRICEVLEDA